MITAKTLQLLDANNYNVSPATCVDSLYFEYTKDGQTYRTSLRNRTLVAGDTITLNASIPTGFTSLSDVTIPYTYFTNVDGTSDSTGRIIQANSDIIKIGDALGTALANDLKPYITKVDASSNFLHVDNSNWVESTLRVRKSGAVTLSSDSDKHGAISFADNLTIASGDTQIGNGNNGIKSLKSFEILSNDTVTVVVKDVSRIVVNESQLTLDALTVNMTGDNINIESSAGGVNIVSKSTTPVKLSNISASSTGVSIDVNPNNIKFNAPAVYLYEAQIQNPNDESAGLDKNKSLYLKVKYNADKNAEAFTWESTPYITLKTSDIIGKSNNSTMLDRGNTNLYQSVIFTQDSMDESKTKTYTLLSTDGINNDGTNIAEDIYIRSIQSGDIISSLLTPARNIENLSIDNISRANSINLVTINNKSLITDTSTDNLSLLTMNDVSCIKYVNYTKTAESTQQYKIFGCMAAELIKLNNSRTKTDYSSADATIHYSDSVYFRGNGGMYATAYYCTSDERRKTEIENIDIEIMPELPELKKFVWRDTSRLSYGFIAQEVECVYPELVDEDSDGLKRIDQYAALSLLCAQLQNENRKLREDYNILKSEISEINNFLKISAVNHY